MFEPFAAKMVEALIEGFYPPPHLILLPAAPSGM